MTESEQMFEQASNHAQRLSILKTFMEQQGYNLDFNELMELDTRVQNHIQLNK